MRARDPEAGDFFGYDSSLMVMMTHGREKIWGSTVDPENNMNFIGLQGLDGSVYFSPSEDRGRFRCVL